MTSLFIFCTVESGLDAINHLLNKGYKVSGIIGLKANHQNKEVISGFVDIGKFASKHNINFYYVEKYSLNSKNDEKLISNLKIDLLWVNGWQRLLPSWVLKIPKIGTIGCHGSPDGITMGRGRSPQNWALMLGSNTFEIALFKLQPGIDDGPIILTTKFYYNFYDDIRTSYYKVSLAISDMMIEILKDINLMEKAKNQDTLAYYLPQRLPEDGLVDWNSAQLSITKHCNALTKPYPGIRCFDGDVKIIIWNCQPFDDKISGAIGCINTCFNSNEFLVNCLDGRILIRNYTASSNDWFPKEGIKLNGQRFSIQLEKIIERHNMKNPSNNVSPRLKRWTD